MYTSFFRVHFHTFQKRIASQQRITTRSTVSGPLHRKQFMDQVTNIPLSCNLGFTGKVTEWSLKNKLLKYVGIIIPHAAQDILARTSRKKKMFDKAAQAIPCDNNVSIMFSWSQRLNILTKTAYSKNGKIRRLP